MSPANLYARMIGPFAAYLPGLRNGIRLVQHRYLPQLKQNTIWLMLAKPAGQALGNWLPTRIDLGKTGERSLFGKMGEPPRLPRRPGWRRMDWHPVSRGPFQALSVHSQRAPDLNDTGEPMPEAQSAWRFEMTVALQQNREFTIIGRTDPTGLRILVRSAQPLGQRAQQQVRQLAGQMLIDGRLPVSIRFDSEVRLTDAAGRKQIDRRA